MRPCRGGHPRTSRRRTKEKKRVFLPPGPGPRAPPVSGSRPRALLGRRAGRGARLADDDRLDVHELADAEDAELATVAAAFDPAERQPRIRGDHAVDEDIAGLDAPRELFAALDV